MGLKEVDHLKKTKRKRRKEDTNMAKKVQSKFMKELSSWAKPTKGIVFTPGKAVYSLAKTAFRHPYITLAATLAGGVKRSRHLR